MTTKPTGWIDRPSDRLGSLPRNWSTIRRRILRRDPTCRLCHRARSVEVDHIGRSDDHSDENLRGVCQPCHAKRSSSQGGYASGEVRRARAASRFRPQEQHPGAY